jgi:hypothetical protein
MGDVGQHLVLAGEVHQEAVVAHQAVGVALLGQPRVHVAMTYFAARSAS